jgi:DNA-binding beta-propeller fold protein YncE
MGYVVGGIVVVIIWALCCSGGTVTKKICEDDGFFHNVTYEKAFNGSAGKQLTDEATSEQCFCTGVGGQIAKPAISGLLHKRDAGGEDNCHSDLPLPNLSSSGAISDFGGGGGGGAGTGENPGPPNNPQPSGTLIGALARGAHETTRQTIHQTSQGSAFTYTLPFRALPVGPLFTGTVGGSISPTCNVNLNPTFFRVYHTDNVVDRNNICTGQNIVRIKVPDLPLQVRVTPDGSTAIVTSYSGVISFIDTGNNQVSGSLQYPKDPNFTPSGLAISPDGAYALVTNYEPAPDSYLLVVDVATQQVKQQINLRYDYPQSVFINPDGTLAWITYPYANAVEVMDILTGTIVRGFSVAEPSSVGFNATGTQVFLASGLGSVEVLNAATYAMITTIPAGVGATDLQLSPDGAFMWVNNSAAKSVTVIETASLTGTTYNIPGIPFGSVVVPTQ